ncbi:flavocytochrome c [Adlercreutzia sp. R25]|uniref:Urocanate reductase n=1 Tax=Adlercreutzia shanghongiae TaxID=3111773 RepID=A0ABU6IZR7_9ACTN|nr:MULTISPECIES: flavocytochrome c [unclassified Adlercreutzia]MEC4272780.1 flavocytochrome c [Adlercreutzia sp. R25]MEC4295102.1 flavocytochrome c [Adlercreutzia sp. R22]
MTNEIDITLSRKSFLKGAAMAGIAAMTGGALAGCAPTTKGSTEDTPALAKTSTASGTFVGKADGMGGEVRVEVTLANGQIADVRPLFNNETPGLTDLTFRLMPQEMIVNQSYEVDTVSGATMSSMALKNAVKDALEQAGVDTSEYSQAITRSHDAEDETIDTEFVVVGSGGAGLSAAVTLAERGKQVVIVEKMPRLGGNTLVCGALMNSYDPIRTKGTKYEDATVQDFIDWTWEGGNEAGKKDVIQVFAEQSWPTTQWLVDEIGVIFYKDLQGSWGHMPELPNGLGFINPFVKKVEEYGIPCCMESTLTEIIMDGDRAAGIIAEKEGGGILTVNASKGVIMATGGLGHNLEMVKELDPRYDDITLSTNPVNATGECFAIAEAAGANLINMDSIQAVHFADPATGQVDWDLESPNSIFVNKEGKRFMNEEMPRDDSVAGLSQQTDHLMFTISDSKDWPTMDTVTGFGVTIGECIERGKGFKADTLEELAELVGCDAAGLTATIEEYNAMIEVGEDTAFQLVDMKERSKIDQPPFYASKLTIAIHYTNGGIEINPQAQVLDKSGNVIPGLYAAGECSGGVMGTNRMGGNSVADVMIFGRIAGMAE